MPTITVDPTVCRSFDCYQVVIQVDIPESAGCIARKYNNPLGCFSIKRVPSGADECKNMQEVDTSGVPPAVLLRVDIDRCDCTKAVFTAYVKLSCNVLCFTSDSGIQSDSQEPGLVNYNSEKFSLSFLECGHESELVTFLVNPLPYNVVVSGVSNNCCKYEITRVPCRRLVASCTTCGTTAPESTTTETTLTPPPTTAEPIFGDCCCRDVNLSYYPGSVLNIMFPLTKDIKCLAMDLGLSGTMANIAMSTIIRAKVRLVSSCPFKFSLPALLTYDKTKCTACLEIVATPDYLHALIKGYEYLYGSIGCGNDGDCKDDHTVSEILEGDFDIQTYFSVLASSKKIDVMGVDKCTEKIFFSFQLCPIQVRDFKVAAACGTCDTEPTVVLDSSLIPYRVQSDVSDFSFEFLVPIVPQTTTTVIP